MGLKREAAATFSFLLAIPVIGGAILLKLVKLATGSAPPVEAAPLAVGVVVSFVVGVAALRLLLKCLQAGRLEPFGWWCVGLGALVLICHAW